MIFEALIKQDLIEYSEKKNFVKMKINISIFLAPILAYQLKFNVIFKSHYYRQTANVQSSEYVVSLHINA